MHTKNPAGRRTLQRFVVVFAAFALLLTLLLMPVYNYVEKTVREAELDRCTQRLREGAADIDSAIQTLNNLALTTQRDSRFLALRVQDAGTFNVANLSEMRMLINALLLGDPLLADRCSLLYGDCHPPPICFSRMRSAAPHLPGHNAKRTGSQPNPTR